MHWNVHPSRKRRRLVWLGLACCLLLSGAARSQKNAPRQFTLDLAHSQITLTLVQSGLLGKRYPMHLVAAKSFSGAITLPKDERQATVTVEAEAKSFANADKAMSEFERRGFHDVLHNKVLESDRFPTIKFKSASVTNVKATGATRALTLHGDLTLHGVTKRVALPVTATLDKDQLRATGEAKLKQSDFGMTPYADKVGLVKIGDELTVSFAIVAKPQ